MPSVSSRLGLALLTFVCSALRVFEPRFSVFAMIGGLLPRRTSFELFDEMRFSWRHDLLLRPPVIRTQRSHRKTTFTAKSSSSVLSRCSKARMADDPLDGSVGERQADRSMARSRSENTGASQYGGVFVEAETASPARSVYCDCIH